MRCSPGEKRYNFAGNDRALHKACAIRNGIQMRLATIRKEHESGNLPVRRAIYSSQLPVLGRAGQNRLRSASIHVSATGRLGMQVIFASAAAGVGRISSNDPQVIEDENFGSFIFCRRPDIGRQKTLVLARFLDGIPGLEFDGLGIGTESNAVDPLIARSDLVVSCANTLSGRLAAERKAIQYGKPVLQVAAYDGRERLGGVITLRRPENPEGACFGCYFPDDRTFPRGEGLLSTVTTMLAAMAANIAVQVLSGVHSEFISKHNFFSIDLERYRIEALAVERRKGCEICERG